MTEHRQREPGTCILCHRPIPESRKRDKRYCRDACMMLDAALARQRTLPKELPALWDKAPCEADLAGTAYDARAIEGDRDERAWNEIEIGGMEIDFDVEEWWPKP